MSNPYETIRIMNVENNTGGNNISAVGAHVLGGSEMPNAQLLRDVADAGLHIHQFVGA